jgi:hypothetical protein
MLDPYNYLSFSHTYFFLLIWLSELAWM